MDILSSRNDQSRLELLGFVFGNRGVHSSRTLMSSEIESVFSTVSFSADEPELERLILGDNLLHKPTQVTRRRTLSNLRSLYGLSSEILVFRALEKCWRANPNSHGLLAFLCAVARDPILRSTTSWVLDHSLGEQIQRESLEKFLHMNFGSRFSPKTYHSMSQNILSTYTQSGHLKGKVKKTREKAPTTDACFTYAAFLAYLEGFRSRRIISSPWMNLLDADETELSDLARTASIRGLMVFRQVGDILEFAFPSFLTSDEERTINEQ